MTLQISPEFFSRYMALAMLWIVVWVGFLYRILTRTDFDVMTRILWVIVVVFVPFFGVGLYLVAAPDSVRGGSGIKQGAVNLSSDVAGTPWETDSGHTKKG